MGDTYRDYQARGEETAPSSPLARMAVGSQNRPVIGA
jgi:hypothetical protein